MTIQSYYTNLNYFPSNENIQNSISIEKNIDFIVQKQINEISQSFATIQLPNFRCVHLNKNGEAFYLTPIGGNRIDQYSKKLDEYTKALVEFNIQMIYNDKGHLIDGKKIIEHSIATRIENLCAKEHVINLWIQSCHFIVVKSEERYWFLHYDPSQSRQQENQIGGLVYQRPNYSELKPVLPYNLEGIALKDNEKIQIVVVHSYQGYNINDPDNLKKGQFDLTVFKNFVGEDKVLSIKTVCCKDFFKEEKDQQIEIDFNTQSQSLTLFLKGYRDKPVCIIGNLFPH